MKAAIVVLIAKKEVAAITRSRALWMPMVILPLVMFIGIPALIGIMAQQIDNEDDLRRMLAELPPKARAMLGEGTAVGIGVRFLLNQMLAPLFILVPQMVASVLAADAFAGERERKTLEALLHTPASDLEIFAGKALGAFIPALVCDVCGLLTMLIVVNVTSAATIGFYLPNAAALLMTLWLAPAIAGCAVVVMVFISSRVKGFQEANQLSVIFILPLMGVMMAQAAGALILGPLAVFVIGLVVFAVDVGLVWVAAATFTRDQLFLRL